METENDVIWDRARFLARRFQKDEIPSMTLLILYDLGMPLNYVGFGYLMQVLPEALKRPSQIVAKEVYLAVAKLYTPELDITIIDSAIRDAIEKAWENRCDRIWHYYFPDHLLQRRKPPSNLEFIAGIVYFLEMCKGCCKEVQYAGK